MQAALDEVFDQAIVFHGFTDYMRDYEVITYSTADPATGIEPAYARFLFRFCVEADVQTTVTPQTWRRSLDDRLIDYDRGKELDGYVWGVKWHDLYPGGRVLAATSATAEWSEAVGIDFFEAVIETNAHRLRLVFGGLEVTPLKPGYRPFEISE